MKNFRIIRLRVSGPEKIDGIVNFTDGLNIIRGRSNTGKTWILKCILYLFGSDNRPFSPMTGYTDIEGIFDTKRYGKITITRKIDKQIVHVTAESNEIVDGEYYSSYKSENKLYLNDLWLRVIGIDETIMIPSSSRYARERISWRNIANVFIVDENEIDKSESIIIKDSMYETAVLASLYFLLTGDYKKDDEEILKPEVASARKNAVVDFIDSQAKSLNGMKASYLKQLEDYKGVDIESKIDETTKKIALFKISADFD